MDPSLRFRICHLCTLTHHHHHHHHHHATLCHHHHLHHYHHNHCHQFCRPQQSHSHHHHHSNCNYHSHVCPRFPPPPPPLQNPEFFASYPLQKDFNLEANIYKETSAPGTQVILEPDLEGLEEEEEDEPVFVLSDEWGEFFARSEAKRKLEKQEAKRKGKR